MSQQSPLIAMQDVTKVYFTDELETHALSKVNLQINKGDYVSIEGPSGCGKSTLLSILALMDTPTEGCYSLNGRSVHDLDHRERARIRNRQIGVIFQAFNLIGHMSVFENVELPLTFRRDLSKAERQERVMKALSRVNMPHRIHHYPGQLSGGQQQRVAVARALVCDPAILLADEPTGNLDSKNGESVMDLLEQLHVAGATVCVVTHDPRYSNRADRKIHIFDGLVVDEERAPRFAQALGAPGWELHLRP